jgi:hypothetical protein
MKINVIILSLLVLSAFCGCTDKYIDDLYVEPDASFKIAQDSDKSFFEVFETVNFKSTGAGQNFVIFTGDKGHVYGESGATGYAATSDGLFSYSYQEPGEYKVTWVASSIKDDGTIVSKSSESTVVVKATNGGLDQFSISNFYNMAEYSNSAYEAAGKFVDGTTVVCPLIFESWKKFSLLSKLKKLTTTFRLASSLANLYWIDPTDNTEYELVSGSTATRVVSFTDASGKLAVQKFKVVTASGNTTEYNMAALMIPEITSFSVNVGGTDYKATITRETASYDKFDAVLSLPDGTDLTSLKPEFVVLENNSSLTDGTNYAVTVGGVNQTSGVTSVDFTSKQVNYNISMSLLGNSDPKYTLSAQLIVTIK